MKIRPEDQTEAMKSSLFQDSDITTEELVGLQYALTTHCPR